MASSEVIKSPVITGMMKGASECPFCGARQGITPDVCFLRIERGAKGIQRYYVSCWQCGAAGASSELVDGAFDNWNRRPSKTWQPLADHTSYPLNHPETRTIMVYDEGRISLVDWVNDQIQSQLDVNLGNFRVCSLRGKTLTTREALNDMREKMRE